MYNKKSTNTTITEPTVDSVEGTITNLGSVTVGSWRFVSIIYDIF